MVSVEHKPGRSNYVRQLLSRHKQCWSIFSKLAQKVYNHKALLKLCQVTHLLLSCLRGELVLRCDFSSGEDAWQNISPLSRRPVAAQASPHRDPLWVLRASCQSECPSAASLPDEVWTMENKVGARGARRLNEPISQIIRLVDMLIFLP